TSVATGRAGIIGVRGAAVGTRGLVAIATLVIASTVGIVGDHAQPTSQASIDVAVQRWIANSPDLRTQVMIKTAPGTRTAVQARLEGFAITSVQPSSSPDLLVAKVDRIALNAAIADKDVLNISSDAPVRGQQLNLNQTLGGLLQKVANPLDLTASLLALSPSHLLVTLGLANSYGGTWLLDSRTGAGVGVALIDSGLDQKYTSIDNVDYYVAPCGLVRHVGGRAEGYGHGTHVGGLLASNGMSSSGTYRGVASSAKVVVFKVLDSNGQGSASDVINAVNYVAANRAALGIDVITMSLGHPIYEPASRDPLVSAVQNAAAQGLIVVVSAGNFGGDPVTHETGYAGITSPGNAPNAITVGATETYQTNSRNDDEVAWFSSRGPTWFDAYQKPDVVAPGSHLISNISTNSTIYRDYPGGIVKSGAMPFFKM